MTTALRILMLEDDPYDAELEIATLREAGYVCQWERVETQSEFLAHLQQKDYDLVLADYHLPAFDGLTALKLCLKLKPEVPFILISGTMGEELAVESVKAGATDYVLKERLLRLALAVERALRERAEQQQRKRAEEELKRQKEILQTIFDHIPVMINLFDSQGQLQFANQEWEQTLGWSVEEIRHYPDPLTQFYPDPDYYQYVLDFIKAAGSEWLDFEVVTRHGRRIETAWANVRLSDGSIIGIGQDITLRKQMEAERSRMEEQFRQAQKIESIGRLAGGIAHDLNNLLVPIIGYTEMGLMKLPQESGLYADLMQVRKAAERAANLTRQILAFSRKQVLEMRILDLNQLIVDFEQMLRRLIGEDIEVETFLDPSLGMIKADRSQIEQILMNLAVNARDAMPNGGKLIIETANVMLDEHYVAKYIEAQSGPHIMLTVSDTGQGMDAETQSHLFEPFFTTKEKGKGTGLGLATVHGIVKQHNGNVWVYSEPGHGTTFKIYLPQVETTLRATSVLADNQAPARGHETILVVEDEEMVRILTCDSLAAYGYQVLEARNAAEGQRLAEQYQGRIDLLLTDVIMPHMNGKELYQDLATAAPQLKVLYMSGYTDNVIAQQDILYQGAHFLQKPFTVRGLIQKVREVLD